MQHYIPIFHALFAITGQAAPAGQTGSPPDVLIWVALITGTSGIAAALLNNFRATRHSAQIQDLHKQLEAVKGQLRRERLTWHWWARQVVAYLRSLPDGEEIADGLPPLPDSIKHSVVSRFRGPRGHERRPR